MKRQGPDLHSLSVQMILSFIALVLLTAVAAGVPAIWLIRNQLERQAWAQVDQARRATLALYTARQSELEGLATLAAQRPTLRRLLAEGEQDALLAYLHTLQEGSGLDLVLVCSSDGQPLAQPGETIPDGLCTTEPWATLSQSGFYVLPAGQPLPVGQAPQVWLFAAHPLDAEDTSATGGVLVGLALDDEFARQMQAQTGLDHTLLAYGQPVATSLASRESTSCTAGNDATQGKFDLDGLPYYATCLPLGEGGVKAELALDVTDIAATQRDIVWTLVASILGVAVVASLLGTYLARRIGRPLTHLAQAADAMSQGDLAGPLIVEARVREVAQLAQALESARADLQGTLAELRREKDWTDHLLEAIVEGIVTLDRKGHITFFSNGAERITGWQRDEVMGRTCDQMFQPVESDQSFSQLIPAPGRRQKITVELRDGRQATLAVTGARLLPPAGHDAQVALVFRDVSEEEAIHRLLGHFLANVAHEFRTPLSALAASVELLLDQAPDLSAAELEELLASLHLGVLGLQTLIDNLLESSSIEAGHFRVHPRPSNLGEIVADAIRTMQPLLDKHNQRLVVELPAAMPMVYADPRRTVQVLVNLLSNASRYGPDDAEIEMTVTVQQGWVRVTMADSGPGVPAQYRDELFRRFSYPVPGNDKAQVGAGLGLSVVKAIVEGHGGRVGIDDHESGGSVFWFLLPQVNEC